MDDVRRLSFPRRIGTPGEAKAVDLVEAALEDAGLAVRRELFRVPFFWRGVRLRACLGISALATWTASWLSEQHPMVGAVGWGVAAAVLQAPWLAARLPVRNASATSGINCQNLLASRPFGGEPEPRARVVFLAHLDSKSQPLPTGLRVGLVVAGLLACVLSAAWCLLAAAGLLANPSGPLTAIPAGLLLLTTALLALNTTGNRSPGALDNASGVATLLEIARNWRLNRAEEDETLWLVTSAEETGLDGAREFVRRHLDWCRACPTLVINLDSVGSGDAVLLAGSSEGLGLAQQTADRLGIPWGRLRVVGAGMDHEPFAAQGLSTVTLLGDVVGRSLDLHSPRDTPDRVEPPALERAGRLAVALAESWASRHVPEAVETPGASATRV